MLKGQQSLADLGAELDRRMAAKQDFVADSRDLRIENVTAPPVADNVVDIERTGTGATPEPATPPVNQQLVIGSSDTRLAINEHAHGQIADRLQVPRRYYDRMQRLEPELFRDSLNIWFQRDNARRMLRTMDFGNDPFCRAFLSDRYLRIENERIIRVVLEAMAPYADQGGISIKSMQVTDKHLYLQVVFPKVQGEVKVGDVVQSGFIVRNSEIGIGRLSALPLSFRLACLNGMVVPVIFPGLAHLRKTHLGGTVEGDKETNVAFKEDTLAAADEALALQLRDTIDALADPKVFETALEAMQAAAASTPVSSPVKAVEALAKVIPSGFTEGDRESLLENFIRDGDYSKWGMSNAVTSLAHKAGDNYDRSVEFEELGGRVLSLNRTQWERIAEAA